MNLLGARFVSRLLLSLLIAHDALVGTVWRLGLGLCHALLSTMFAALILDAFQVVLSGHAIKSCFAIERLELFQQLFHGR